MAILFPSNPTTGDTFTAVGKTWTWNGAQWEGVPAVVSSGIPSGETADRPANPDIGDQFYNGTLGVLEIYTTSGWLPATGANDFNVVLNGEDTSVILDKEYFAGAYTINSALSDTSFDIYLFDTQGNAAGYTNSPSINAISNFNKIVVLGGQAGDLLSFSYKTTFTTASITDEVTAGPIIKSISIADLPNVDDTTVITGINFAEDIQVTFTGTDSVALSAKSVVRSSATSLLVTRPDNLIEDYSPYTVTVTNPGITAPSGTSGHISTNAITAGGDPIWVTASGALPDAVAGQPYSTTIASTDPDGGTITYSIVTGQLPPGLSLNASSGVISGTPDIGDETFIVSATDSGGNVVNRSFSLLVKLATGGTITQIDGYQVHTFTSNGTFELFIDTNIEYLVVGGGGSGGEDIAGGGGAGGLLTGSQAITAGSYSVVIGAGGASGRSSGESGGKGNNGNSTTAFGITALKGAAGGGEGDPNGAGGSGLYGSGGGAGYSNGSGGAGTSGQGNRGGNSVSGVCGGGGGSSGQGQDPNGSISGSGGPGTLSTIDGNNYYYAAGGGASGWSNATAAGDGGIGGGGGGGGVQSSYINPGSGGGSARNNGSGGSGGNGGSAGANTGSGGGGAGESNPSINRVSGSGGSGIVIVRFPV